MRVRKTGFTKRTDYRYDGQMGIEDLERDTGAMTITAVTRYGLGARGIDVVSQTTTSGGEVSYPLYDTHGNNVGSLAKSGNSFTVSEELGYDAWGGIRSGVASDGKSRYCASIGHKQDDESDLIYMRARYYEPTSGRFVSEDRAMDGANWFAYCGNQPVTQFDSSGQWTVDDISNADAKTLAEWAGAISSLVSMAYAASKSGVTKVAALTHLAFMFAWFTGHGYVENGNLVSRFIGGVLISSTITLITHNASSPDGLGASAVGFYIEYASFLVAFMALEFLYPEGGA